MVALYFDVTGVEITSHAFFLAEFETFNPLNKYDCMNMLTVADVIEIMEIIAPPHLAEQWDNSGLQIGSKKWPVEKIWVALDPTRNVIQTACKNGVNLLITHHPMFFKPFKILDLDSALGKLVENCIYNRLSVYSAHTNFDSVRGGLNDIFSDRIGLSNCRIFDHVKPSEKLKLVIVTAVENTDDLLNIFPNRKSVMVHRNIHSVARQPEKNKQAQKQRGELLNDQVDNWTEVGECKVEAVLSETEIEFVISQIKQQAKIKKIHYEISPLVDLNYEHGLGRVGDLKPSLSLKKLAFDIKRRLKLNSIRIVGDPDKMISKVAVCTGSGASLVGKFITSEAQVYISGDIKYHDAMTVLDAGKGLIDVGHFSSEQLMIDAVAARIKNWVEQSASCPVEVEACPLETEPFSVI